MSSTAVTTTTRFISQTLENLYAGGSEVGSTFSLTALGMSLASFRGDNSGETQNATMATIDATIQSLETAYVPTTAAAGTTAQSYPVDQSGIMQQLMAQVFAQLISAGSPPGSTYTANSPVTSSGFVNNSSLPDNFSALDFNPNDPTSSSNSAYYFLNQAGQNILTTYYNLIQGTFAEGALTASNPLDPNALSLTGVSLSSGSTAMSMPTNTTNSLLAAGAQITGAGIPIGTTVTSVSTSGNTINVVLSQAATETVYNSATSANNTVVTAEVTQIPPQTIDGVTYGYVTAFGNYSTNPPTYQSYLVPTGIVLQAVAKQAIDNAADAPGNAAASGVGYRVTFVNSADPSSVTLLPVDSTTFQPTGGPTVTMNSVRFMDAITYTYFWNEARVAVMKGQLNYQQDVVQMLQNALSAANAASTDLTQQSGLTEQENSSQQPDPDASPETASLNMFIAIVSTEGSTLFQSDFANSSTGDASSGVTPFYFNYSEWQANQVALKNYTDNLNSQAQNAMLDYQQTLNNYNQAYQVMGQIQNSFNTMFQSQLQNFLSTTG
jgi:hypothetical protein